MSRIRVRRVAHAVLWGDGLRFRVRDGRLLYYLPSTLCACVVHRQARLHGPAVFARLPCLAETGAWQQIRISRWRVTPGRALGGVGSQGRARTTYTRTRAYKSPRAKAIPEVRSSFLPGSSWVSQSR